MKTIWLPLGILFVSLILFLPTLAGMQQVGGLFGEARYADARQALAVGASGSQPGEEVLWRCRLETSPVKATNLLTESLTDPAIPESTRQGLALQLAQIHFARGDYNEAHVVLNEIISQSTLQVPGEIYLLAALTERTAGNLQAAREMLASVKPDDPAFEAARYYLGDIGLESNDPELALRYFESGQKNSEGEDFSRLKAGQWRALRINGQDQAAARLLLELERDSASCLALVEIGRVLQLEDDENSARVAAAIPAETDTLATAPTDFTGRYCLQLGAFSDRSLALEFKYRHQDQVPDLTITQVRDQRGQFLYKVRFGSSLNPALARSEAQRQKNKLGMDVMVVDLSSTDSGR